MTQANHRAKLPPSKLQLKVKLLLRESKHSYVEIQRVTRIHQGWISMFAQGKINDPSANRLEPIYEFLTGKKLEY